MGSLEKEFDKWQTSVGDDACFIWLDGSSTSVTLLLDGSDEFTIRTPSSSSGYVRFHHPATSYSPLLSADSNA